MSAVHPTCLMIAMARKTFSLLLSVCHLGVGPLPKVVDLIFCFACKVVQLIEPFQLRSVNSRCLICNRTEKLYYLGSRRRLEQSEPLLWVLLHDQGEIKKKSLD